MYKKSFLTDQEFADIIRRSDSVAQVIREAGLVPAGGNYATVRDRIRSLGLSTSHFTRQSHRKGRIYGPKNDIAVFLNNSRRVKSHVLKARLLKEGYLEAKCYACNLTEWQGAPIPLELHHIDGDNQNNDLGNLTVLCPNCHAQTKNYRGKNITR